MRQFFSGMLGSYFKKRVVRVKQLYKRHPFLRGMLSYAIIWPVADLLEQRREGRSILEYDWMAALRYGAVGVTCVGPVSYAWLKVINKVKPTIDSKSSVRKAIYEQIFFWPVFIVVFIGGLNFYEPGRTLDDFKNDLKQKYLPIHLMGACFWPLIAPILRYSNLIKDPKTKLTANSIVGFLWANFLAFVISGKHKPVEFIKEDPDEVQVPNTYWD